MEMTAEEKIVDLLADGLDTEDALRAALTRDGFDPAELTRILSDLTEQDFAEIVNPSKKRVKQEGDRILDFTGLKIVLSPAGIKRWMLEDAKRNAE